jgi:hypothetical protein
VHYWDRKAIEIVVVASHVKISLDPLVGLWVAGQHILLTLLLRHPQQMSSQFIRLIPALPGIFQPPSAQSYSDPSCLGTLLSAPRARQVEGDLGRPTQLLGVRRLRSWDTV